MIPRALFAATAVVLSVLRGGHCRCTARSRRRSPAGRAEAVRSVRLYVLDGGILESDPGRYRLKPEEVATTQLSVAAYLVAHPTGHVDVGRRRGCRRLVGRPRVRLCRETSSFRTGRTAASRSALR